jgi:hypothetical protein
MKFKWVKITLWTVSTLAQSIYSFKIAQLETNESNYTPTHVQLREKLLLASDASTRQSEKLANKFYHERNYQLQSVVKEIDLNFVSVYFKFPDNALYINEGNQSPFTKIHFLNFCKNKVARHHDQNHRLHERKG